MSCFPLLILFGFMCVYFIVACVCLWDLYFTMYTCVCVYGRGCVCMHVCMCVLIIYYLLLLCMSFNLSLYYIYYKLRFFINCYTILIILFSHSTTDRIT